MGHNTTRIIGTQERILSRSRKASEPIESEEQHNYRAAKKRAVRYWYVLTIRTKHGNRYRAEIVGPFHSRLYGTCSYGATKALAKARLKATLANDYGFLGTMLLANKDESDTVGLSASELLRRTNNVQRKVLPHSSRRPISALEAVGSAGQ
jgi:hypothetical protein